jgi:ABC-2 type transport system ATP-binding protein
VLNTVPDGRRLRKPCAQPEQLAAESTIALDLLLGSAPHNVRDVIKAIEIEGLVKKYGAVDAVRGVSLAVKSGETLGYLGPNGAGKTTTIRCMLGLLRPTSGSIRILGRDVGSDLSWILERVGHVPGEFGLWPQLTGRECLRYLGSLHPRGARGPAQLCERFELAQADLDRQVRFHSRGTRQKLAIVQAFQHDPEVVVLDEPTEGLDPVMKERFIALLAEYRAAGGATFLSSHILSEVEEVADRVAVLRAGRVVREGPAHDLAGDRVCHCTLTLKRPVPHASLLELPGVSGLSGEGRTLRFDYRGGMEPLIRSLAALPVEEFLSERESLLEAFFEVYGEEVRA